MFILYFLITTAFAGEVKPTPFLNLCTLNLPGPGYAKYKKVHCKKE